MTGSTATVMTAARHVALRGALAVQRWTKQRLAALKVLNVEMATSASLHASLLLWGVAVNALLILTVDQLRVIDVLLGFALSVLSAAKGVSVM
jgi:hypothetical protein